MHLIEHRKFLYTQFIHIFDNTAIQLRKAILRELDRCVVKNVDELRIQELSMLNQMHSECWQLFMDKSNKARLFAADRLLSLSEARRKLMGLDQTPDGVLNAGMVVVREAPPGLLGPSQS